MSDATQETQEDAPAPRPRPTIGQRLRKLVILVGLLIAAWVVFAQAIPRGLLSFRPETANKEHDTATPPPRLEKAMSSPETPHDKDEQIDAMKERIDQLEAKLKTVEDAKAPDESDETKDKMEKMQAKIDALLQMPHTSTIDNERVGHLEDTISKQQENLNAMQTELSTMHEKSTRDVTVITAFTSLRDAVLRGSSYGSQLMQLTPLVADPKSQDMLAQLKPMAEHGIGTQEQLQAEFQGLLPKALNVGKGNALERNLHSLIRIRKVGEQQTGADDEAVLARAEAKLARGDIDGSVKETTTLSPQAATFFAPWNTKAQDLVRMRNLMDALQLALLQNKPAADVAPSAGAKAEISKLSDIKAEPKTEAAPVPTPVPDAPKESPKEDVKPEAKPEAPDQSVKPEALPETKPASTL